MHSWVFRNRARLRLIYGCAPLDPPSPPALPQAAPLPALPAPLPEGAGEVERDGEVVILRPMPYGGSILGR